MAQYDDNGRIAREELSGLLECTYILKLSPDGESLQLLRAGKQGKVEAKIFRDHTTGMFSIMDPDGNYFTQDI